MLPVAVAAMEGEEEIVAVSRPVSKSTEAQKANDALRNEIDKKCRKSLKLDSSSSVSWLKEWGDHSGETSSGVLTESDILFVSFYI
jgi:hypothetical protein